MWLCLSLRSSPDKAVHFQTVIVQVSNILLTCGSRTLSTLSSHLPFSSHALPNLYFHISPLPNMPAQNSHQMATLSLCLPVIGQSLSQGLLSFPSERECKLCINTSHTSQYVIAYFSHLFPPQLFSWSDKIFLTVRKPIETNITSTCI